MIEDKWLDNELYIELKTCADTEEQANNMFNSILPYMIEHYGEDNVTVLNLIFIMPVNLYKASIYDNVSYYKDLVQFIGIYKMTHNCDSGFPIKKYEDVYDVNIKYDNAKAQKQLVKEQHKILREQKKLKTKQVRQPLVKTEDFDETLIINEQNIINHVKQSYEDVTFLKPENITNSVFNVKNLYNCRIGKVVYKIPFKINNIKDQSIYWIGMCDCGNHRIAQGGRAEDYTSCGKCDSPEHIYVGERKNHLECIDQRYLLNGKKSLALMLKVKCDCGSTMIMSPGQFEVNSGMNCGKRCKYAIEHRHIIHADNGEHFKPMFHKDTNVSKIGRTEGNANSSTGYLGVTFMQNTGKYMAYITFQHRTETLGQYNTAEEAYRVRLSAQNMLHIKFLTELDEDEFVQNNKHLVKLLEKVKQALYDNTQIFKEEE